MINSVETDVNRLSYSDFNELVRLRNILLLQEKEFSDEVERNQNLLSETITVQGQQVICGNLILHFMNVVMDVDAIIAKISK